LVEKTIVIVTKSEKIQKAKEAIAAEQPLNLENNHDSAHQQKLGSYF
jgi:hypothetical protein